jgi:tetratricopeptide (TPR) repeat protein
MGIFGNYDTVCLAQCNENVFYRLSLPSHWPSMMKNTKKEIKIPDNQNSYIEQLSGYAPFVILFLFFLLGPVIPDIKLTRPKLLFTETSLYAALFLWAALSCYWGKLKVRNSFLTIPMLVYAGSVAVFYAFSPDKPVALSELKRSLLSVTAYFTVANIIDSEKKRNLTLLALITGSFAAVTYGLMQRYGGFWIIQVPRFERVMSTFGNPIFFAAYLVIAVPITLGCASYIKNKFTKMLLSIMLVMEFTALYFTETRAAFAAIVFAAAVFLWFSVRARLKRNILYIALIVAAGVFVLATKNIWHRQQAHTLIWKDSLVMWAAHPVFGTGPGTFHIYFPKYASKELRNIWPESGNIINDAHNEYIQYLTETGIIGFGIFLWLLVSIFQNASYLHGRAVSRGDKILIACFVASSAGLLAQNMFSVDMRFIISSVYLFAATGFIDSFGEKYYYKERLSKTFRVAGLITCLLLAVIVFRQAFEPYLAQKKVASTPDFFSQQILEPAKTISELEAIAKKYPEQGLVFEKLGWVYSKEKNWGKAIENLVKASKLNPGSAAPLNNLGNIYFLTGDRASAINYWNRSLEINPRQMDSRLNLAVAYYYKGKLKEAADQLREVLKLDPHNEKAIVLLKQMTE